MGTVVSFPTKSVRDWLIIERAMKDKFSELSVAAPVQNRLIEQMQAFYHLLDFQFNFTLDISFPDTLTKEQTSAICHDIGQQVTAAVEKHLQDFTNKLFNERLSREVVFSGSSSSD